MTSMVRDFYRRPKRVVLPPATTVSEGDLPVVLGAAMEIVKRERWGLRDGEDVVFVDRWVGEDGAPAPDPEVRHERWCTGEHYEVSTFGEARPRLWCVTDPPNGPSPDWWQAGDETWQELGYRLST